MTKIDLRDNSIDNAGAEALAEALKEGGTVREIQLELNRIDAEIRQKVEQIVSANRIPGIQTSPTGRRTDHRWQKDAFPSAPRIVALKEQYLTQNRITTMLCITNGRIDDDGIKALANALKHNRSVTELLLPNNGISDAGAKALAEMLKDNSSLTTIELGGNKIGDSGAKALAEALDQNRSVKHMDLRGNAISDKTSKEIEYIAGRNKSCGGVCLRTS